ncbi:MAG: O-antigen ligase family protein, partial [Bacteroidales bacterium]
FVNRNHFAGWMLMALPLGLGYFFALVARGMRGVKPDWHHRLLWFASPDASRVVLVGFGLAVMGVSLVLTFSRSGITCFTIALLLSGVVAIRHQARGSNRAVASTYLVLVFVVAVGWAGLDAVAARFERLGADYAQRTEIWANTLDVFRDFPVLGTGLDTLGTAMFVYQTSQPESHIVEAHNDYLQLLAEGGIALAAAALALLALFVREVRRRFRDDTPDEGTYWIRVGAVTGLVAIALQETVEFSLQMPGNAALFAALAAVAAGRMGHRKKATGYRLRATGQTGAEGRSRATG